MNKNQQDIDSSSENKKKCTLCEKEIPNYSLEFNHLEIDSTHSADICRDCLDKFFKWQQGIYAKLFPTKAMKRIVRKDRS